MEGTVWLAPVNFTVLAAGVTAAPGEKDPWTMMVPDPRFMGAELPVKVPLTCRLPDSVTVPVPFTVKEPTGEVLERVLGNEPDRLTVPLMTLVQLPPAAEKFPWHPKVPLPAPGKLRMPPVWLKPPVPTLTVKPLARLIVPAAWL